jgi:hypothetical protein
MRVSASPIFLNSSFYLHVVTPYGNQIPLEDFIICMPITGITPLWVVRVSSSDFQTGSIQEFPLLLSLKETNKVFQILCYLRTTPVCNLILLNSFNGTLTN